MTIYNGMLYYDILICYIIYYNILFKLEPKQVVMRRDLHRGLLQRGRFQNTIGCFKQHGKQHCCNTGTTCSNTFLGATPFETIPYACSTCTVCLIVSLCAGPSSGSRAARP